MNSCKHFFCSVFILALILDLYALQATGAVPLPYSTRTRSYNLWTTAIRGDLRTIGMGGATLGLPDTFVAALDNPAGLAMTLSGADFNFSSDTIYDGNIQSSNYPVNTSNFGLAINKYPWGFSVGFVAPFQEGQPYQLSSIPNDSARLFVASRQLIFSVARLLFNDRLSLGMSLILGEVDEQITFINSSQLNAVNQKYAVSGVLGASVQLPHRFILGMSYSLPIHFSVGPQPSSGVSNFFQPADVPGRLGIGLGWIPNRFFKTDISLIFVNGSPGASLIKDESFQFSSNFTVQPHLGAAYSFLDYKELKGTLFLGTYFETSRVQGVESRIHGTSGLGLDPWVFTLGWALDTSSKYQNFSVFLGVNVIKIMEKLDFIPPAWHPPSKGAFPQPTEYSEIGLPRPLVENWQPRGPDLDPIQIGLAIPQKIEEKAKDISKTIKEVFEESPKVTPQRTEDAPKKKISKKKKKSLSKQNKSIN